MKATLAKLTRVAGSEELTLEDKGEVLANVLGPKQVVNPVGIESGEEFGTPTVTVRKGAAGPHPSALEAAVISEFEKNGWHVERAELRDVGFDFRARRGDEVMLVEVKARTRLGAADIQRILGYLLPAAKDSGAVPALVVPAGSISLAAREVLDKAGVRLFEWPFGVDRNADLRQPKA